MIDKRLLKRDAGNKAIYHEAGSDAVVLSAMQYCLCGTVGKCTFTYFIKPSMNSFCF